MTIICIEAVADCDDCGVTMTVTLHDVSTEKPPPPTVNCLVCGQEVPMVSTPGPCKCDDYAWTTL